MDSTSWVVGDSLRVLAGHEGTEDPTYLQLGQSLPCAQTSPITASTPFEFFTPENSSDTVTNYSPPNEFSINKPECLTVKELIEKYGENEKALENLRQQLFAKLQNPPKTNTWALIQRTREKYKGGASRAYRLALDCYKLQMFSEGESLSSLKKVVNLKSKSKGKKSSGCASSNINAEIAQGQMSSINNDSESVTQASQEAAGHRGAPPHNDISTKDALSKLSGEVSSLKASVTLLQAENESLKKELLKNPVSMSTDSERRDYNNLTNSFKNQMASLKNDFENSLAWQQTSIDAANASLRDLQNNMTSEQERLEEKLEAIVISKLNPVKDSLRDVKQNVTSYQSKNDHDMKTQRDNVRSFKTVANEIHTEAQNNNALWRNYGLVMLRVLDDIDKLATRTGTCLPPDCPAGGTRGNGIDITNRELQTAMEQVHVPRWSDVVGVGSTPSNIPSIQSDPFQRDRERQGIAPSNVEASSYPIPVNIGLRRDPRTSQSQGSKAKGDPHSMRYFIGNLDKNITPSDLSDYLRDRNVPHRDIRIFRSAKNDGKMAGILTSLRSKSSVLCRAGFWQDDTYARRWIERS